MGNLWLKIKVWTKGLIIGALVIYGLLFLFYNRKPVTFWYWFGHEPETSLLVLITATFLAGVIGTILVRTTFTTLRQMRELRERGRIQRLERNRRHEGEGGDAPDPHGRADFVGGNDQ